MFKKGTSNKKEKTINKINLEFILCHRILFTFIAVILYLVITFLICYLVPSYDEKWFTLNNLEISAEISSFLFIVVSSIIAVWQYCVSCRNEHYKDKTERIQKSIDLIEYYKNNILDKAMAIITIFQNTGITNILKSIDKSKINNFDIHELQELLTNDKIEELKEIQKSQKFFEAILMANEAYNLNLPGISYDMKDNSKPTVTANRLKVVNAFMGRYITETLNNLEYFSMHFAHNIADESVIYQSAHQTFIEIVELLYYNISSINDSGCKKFYTNLISLYIIWRDKQKEKNDDMIKKQRSLIETGSSSKNISI